MATPPPGARWQLLHLKWLLENPGPRHHTFSMARGWESKSVEDQIQERESRTSESASHPKLTPEELQRRNKREGILMARTRTLTSLQTACGGRYRGHLEQVLADLDRQLADLDGSQ